MWRHTSYVVTVYDADSRRAYKHHHDSKKDADVEVGRARQWGFAAWAMPTQRLRLSEEPTRDATM